MTHLTPFQSEMLECVPALRAFAMSLCGNIDYADDLVQDTLLRALANQHTYAMGTTMPAWLFTILRNCFRSQYRKRRREVEDADGKFMEALVTRPDQHDKVVMNQFQKALQELSDDQREAIILVGASGLSYEEAAEICECPVGTIKSRVNRARIRLLHMTEIFDPGELNEKMSRWVTPAHA